MARVRVIPANTPLISAQAKSSEIKKRVAAYARVSTDSDEQLTSYEAQVDYYTKLIKSRENWEFVKVFTDEGISAVNTKRREGFNQMVADALAGGIDLIVTKSVSRFARNTVDSLTTVRKLKEKGVEVWFEKENIFTLDSKGELLITIMSSLAQEESRSISENVTWGQRKRMADGKFSLPYAQFLGYEKGEDGLPVIVPEEAKVVRLIYKLYMEGKTFSAIARHLTNERIPTPAGKKNWQSASVRSILTNEKYKGDALLQKTYCANFLTKEMVENTGQVQQYYVENSHPAIIDPHEFDAVQFEIESRKNRKAPGNWGDIFAGKLICSECGGWFGRKVWGSYKKDKSYRREVYRCNDKYKHKGRKCHTPTLTEEEIKERFLLAFNKLMEGRDGLIEDCKLAQSALCSVEDLEIKIAEQMQELEVVAELSRKAIYENARTAIDQDEFAKRNSGYLERHRKATERIEKLEKSKLERIAKSKMLAKFISDLKKCPQVLSEFDEGLWLAVIDKVTVVKDGTMLFSFRSGTEVTA